jgi:tRNA C32,U32 (ribose-2'-O)-methylase TrmJ
MSALLRGALKNMGFGNLELVKPAELMTGEAKSMACNGRRHPQKGEGVAAPQ